MIHHLLLFSTKKKKKWGEMVSESGQPHRMESHVHVAFIMCRVENWWRTTIPYCDTFISLQPMLIRFHNRIRSPYMIVWRPCFLGILICTIFGHVSIIPILNPWMRLLIDTHVFLRCVRGVQREERLINGWFYGAVTMAFQYHPTPREWTAMHPLQKGNTETSITQQCQSKHSD